MKNLKLLQCKPTKKLPDCVNGCLTNDIDTGTVYVVTSTHFVGFLPETENVVVNIELKSVGLVSEVGSTIIGAQHLPELEAVCFATSSGDVNLYNTAIGQFECVGSVDTGLTWMSWSPDQETVAFTTGGKTIIIMNKDFDLVAEVSINSETDALETPVNVGWGKKETQFHGSLGKEAAKQNKVDLDINVDENDDTTPRISWRGDGQFFVVSSVNNQGVRVLRIWSREGCLVSTGELVNGLGCSLNWRPSGNLIASTQRLSDAHHVIFFEKNGLRHGEFPLRCDQKNLKVISLMWNIDSTVLALWLNIKRANGGPETDPSTSYNLVQLWYSSNYHWFLKQELDFSSSRDCVQDICWDSEFPLKLHVLTQGGSYVSYSFCWEVTQSPGHSSENNSTVVMIDGDKLLSTPMSSFVIPPPMSACCIKTVSSINQVTFHPETCHKMLLLLSDGSLALVNNNTSCETAEEKDGIEPAVQARINLSLDEELWQGPGCLSQLTWWKNNKLVAIARNMNNGKNVVCDIKLSEQDGEYTATTVSTVAVEKDILQMFLNVDTGSLVIECWDGTVLTCKSSDSDQIEIVPWTTRDGYSLTMPHPCSRLETVLVGEEKVVIGLTEHSRLYMNEKEVANNCSSFFIHDQYLLTTTTAHTLRSLSILPDQKGLASLLEGQKVQEHTRNVERGSKIITAVSQDCKLILQMPRGNLETIYPRVLVLSYIKTCLNSFKYKEAFVCMRRHRINLNLICDHNLKLFLDNVDAFITEVESVVFINMFLSDLSEEDITKKLYSEFYCDEATSDPIKPIPNKVDTLCNAVRLSLENTDRSRYLLCILTTYVKKSVPELQAVLNIVKNLKDANNVTAAEEALKYILFLVDVNKMYDVALGMYDFQLVLLVAEKSQKDPKEYLPFLNNLRKLEENYQRYSIDKYLKRYENAIQHLARCGPEKFDECLELIKEHHLYKEALSLYSENSPEHRKIAKCYGDYLVGKRKYDEAGLVLTRCECYEEALESYEKSGNWRLVFCLTSKLSLSEERRLQLARSMAGNLRDNRRHSEAAVVLLDYANDYEGAIEVLIRGHIWEESLRLMYKYDRMDIIETHLKPTLLEAFEQVTTSLETNTAECKQYTSRLKLVREEKERKRIELLENDPDEDLAGDLFSETSSMTGQSTVTSSSLSSRSSRTSGKSTKSRKKHKRKKVSLKEGSQYEDLALMGALSEIIVTVDQMQEEISTLLKMLVLFGHSQKAGSLQVLFSETLTLVQDALPEIWPMKSDEVEQPPTIFGPGATSNTITSAMKENDQTQNKDTPTAPAPPVFRKSLSWRLDQLKL